jgi:hypothetical protein
MKEFLEGAFTLIKATLITVCLFWYLVLHQIIHAFVMTITLKDWTALLKLLWRTIDGTFAVIGYLLYQIGYSQDMMWNVYGEAIEDVTTTKEDTLFGEKGVTVSASIGKEEYEGRLVPSGKKISNILNWGFNQKRHAIDSWLWMKAKEELKKDYFEKKN